MHGASLRGCAAVIGLSLVGGAAHAGYSQSTPTSPGGYIQAGAGLTNGGNPTPGVDFEGNFSQAGEDFREFLFSGNSSVSTTASYTGPSITNGCAGTVGMGGVSLSAHNSGPNNAFFPASWIQGGWKETLTVNNAALNGQAGFLVFQINVSGTLHASGFAGSAAFETSGYVNNIELMSHALFDPGNSDPISTDRQRAEWRASSAGGTENRTISDTVTMAAPIVFGQEFTLGIYGLARAGMRSQSGVAGISNSNVDFSNTLTWGGLVGINVGGQYIDGSTLTSATGIDWTGPVVPAPGATCVAFLAITAAGARRRSTKS